MPPPELVTLAIIALSFAAILVLPLFYAVHRGLDYCCLRRAQSLCRRKGFDVRRSRWRPQFDNSGVKTEFTLVELDCFDAQRERRLVRLVVWPFGVRKLVTDEKYPESHDVQWPQSKDGT